MPLINTSVSNLIQGVSQQADATRFAGQCEEQENALSSVAEGLKKRPNTRHIGRLLTTAIDEDSFVHFIDRDDSEKYCIIQDENKLTIHNALTGNQCTVTEQETSDFSISNNEVSTTGTYLDTTNARKSIKPLTIGDTTFLLNTEKETSLSAVEETSDLSDEALVFIKQGDYKKKYGFRVDGRNRVGAGQPAQVKIQADYESYPTVGNVLMLDESDDVPNWILDGGSGFAANDIVNIVLTGSGTRNIYESVGPDGGERGDFIETITHYLTLYEQPTMKVLTVDDNGAILTAEVINRGAFRYGQLSTDPYDYDVSSSFWTSPSVYSSNNTDTGASGDDAIFEVKQAHTGSWGVNSLGVYSATHANTSVVDARILDGGSGFAVGDILDLPESGFPPSRQWSNSIFVALYGAIPDHPSDVVGDGTLDLNYVNAPQLRVTAVDLVGAITNVSVENGGLFGYGDYLGVMYNTTSSSNNNSTYPSNNDGYIGNFSVISTNSTPVDVQSDDSFSGQRVITTAAGTNGAAIDSSVILDSLKSGNSTDINANFDTDFSNVSSNLLIIKPKKLPSGQNTTKYFNITPIDGLAGEGIGVVHREVSSMSDLPLVAPHGYKVKVVGDAELGQDDFYCKFNLSNSDEANDGDVGQGTWVECAGGRVRNTIDETTMPRLLVNVDENVFQVRRMSFGTLKAGDENSNPSPSFINSTINNIFQYKNRLGFLCRDSVIMSESGFGGFNANLNRQSFNFFRTTVTSLIDSDPIDVTVASNRITNLQAAQGFQENLVLFSANGQFVLKGGSLLTPATVSINPITNFSFEDQVEPIPLGSYIYFPFTRGAFTGVREFVVNASNDTYDAVEITEHVPAYIPKDIIDMAGTTAEDIIVLLSSEDKSSLYVYNYFWNNNQKVLSAWSKFTFTGEIRGVDFIESTLYAVTVNNGETNLVEMPLESGLKDDAGYVTHLDMRVDKTVANGSNTIDLSSDYTPADNSIQVYTKDGLRLDATNSGATVTLAQAVTADTPVFVGIPYTMKYTFSEQIFKAKAGSSSSPSNAAKLMVRNGSLYFDNTAFFKVKVTPKERDTYENIFTSNVVGSTEIGNLDLEDGFFRFPVFTKAQDTVITIENDSALPSNFQSAEFESFVNPRSTRYA